MSRRSVRFEFQCEKARLKFNHDIDSRLLGPLAANPNQHYQTQFLNAVHPILLEHYGACLNASGLTCSECTRPKKEALTTPMSWLHLADDPFVNILVSPLCETGGRCEMQSRRETQKMMEELGNEAEAEMTACKVCYKVEGAQKCARCRTVSYCGKECQKKDWKRHKPVCKATNEDEPK
jgi:hypothetical protein